MGTILTSLFGCKTEEIILHGDIKGTVTDAETSLTISEASVELIKSNKTIDLTNTGWDGTYLLKNIVPEEYEIQVSKYAYRPQVENIEVVEAKTDSFNFALNGIPTPKISVTYLAFGCDLTSLSFTISNIGKGIFNYYFDKKDWISLDPSSGTVMNETDIIQVTIDRERISDSTFVKERIKIFSIFGQVLITDSINVYLGVIDADLNCYKVIEIGSQIWMAENLKTTRYNNGTAIPLVTDSAEFRYLTIPGYCWYNNDSASYAQTYGALYNWYTVNTGNLCPKGWHVPTDNEWKELEMAVGMSQFEADKRWEYRGTNQGSKLAGNADLWIGDLLESDAEFGSNGFTALPGGARNWEGHFHQVGIIGIWWSATDCGSGCAWWRQIINVDKGVYRSGHDITSGFSIRCLMD